MNSKTLKTSLAMLFVVIVFAFSSMPTIAYEMMLWVNCWPQGALDGIQEAANVFADRHPEVDAVVMNAAACGNEHFENLTLGVIGGTPPDVVTMPAPFAQPALAGLLLPLNQYIDQSAIVMRDHYPPFMLESFSYDGTEYGIPALEAAIAIVFIYNQKLFAEAGLPDKGPDTLSDLYELHTKLTRLHPGGEHLEQVGLNPMDAQGGHYFPIVWGTVFDVDWYDQENRQLNLMGFSDTIDYLQRIYDVPGYDYIADSGFGGWAGALASGNVAMQINGATVPGTLASMDRDIDPMGYTWMPNIVGDNATASTPWGMGIPINAPRPDLSFELLEFFATPEALQIVFNKTGWLNGNLAAIRDLDISQAPEVAPIVSMIEQADRFYAPPQLPILTDLYATMSGRAATVFRGEQAGTAMLETLQQEMQVRLDEFFRTHH